ncbi:MAG: Tc toxin subunit A, partial [Bacteroidota bacterium]|nr:Tc toxin subunit A [Bacteroidota bacterium]
MPPGKNAPRKKNTAAKKNSVKLAKKSAAATKLGEIIETSLDRIKKIIPGANENYARKIVAKGYSSAQQVADGSYNDFEKKVMNAHIPRETLQLTYRNAVNVGQWLNKLRASYILPATASSYLLPPISNPAYAFNEEISYTSLFPGTQFCACSECMSNQSPAAFFTAIMEIAATYIKPASLAPAGLSLTDRREDLQTLPLTCDNTNVEQPYLQIVNNILLKYLSKNPNAVTWESIANGKSRFVPYNQPNQHIRSVLAAAGTSLASVAAAFSKDTKKSKEWIYETLGMSASDVELLYSTSNLPAVSITPRVFREKTGLDVDQLEELVFQHLSQDELNATGSVIQGKLFINGQNAAGKPLGYTPKTGTQPEQFTNMLAGTLQNIRSFMTLSSCTGWSYSDLNYVLGALDISQFADEPSSLESLTKLARVKYISETLKLDPIQTVSSIANIVTTGVKDDLLPQAPFDRLFNSHLLLKQQGQTSQPYHPSFAANPLYKSDVVKWAINIGSGNKKIAQVVKLVTATDQHQLEQILSGIPCPALDAMLITRNFGLPLEGNSGAAQTLSLTVENLSILYGHAQAASGLGLPVAMYVELYNYLYPANASNALRRVDLNVLYSLASARDIFSHSSFSLSDYVSVLRIAKKISGSTAASNDVVDFTAQLKTKLLATKTTVSASTPAAKKELEIIIYKQWVHELSVFFAAKENWLYSLTKGLCPVGANGEIDPSLLNKFIETQDTATVAKAIQSLIPHLLFIQKADTGDNQIEFVYRKIIT